MAVREFSGSTDLIDLDNGTLGAINNSAAFSAVILVYPVGVASNKCLMSVSNSSDQPMFSMYTPDGGGTISWGADDPSADVGANVGFITSAWQVVGISKAAGAVTPKIHRKTLGSGSWTHSAASGSVPTSATAADKISINHFGNGTGGANIFVAMAAMFTSNLSDADFENIESNATTDWIFDNLSPAVLWDFNQASTGTIVTDLTGNGADQIAISGTAVETTNVPAWTFGLVGGAPQVLLASADSADGNWTDQAAGSSLAAAIDETTASDTDYIRSELGPQNSGCRVKLAAGGDPASSTGHEINWRIAKDSASGDTINMTVKLYQGGGNSLGGGTLIADFDRNSVSDTFTSFTETLSGGEADAITDYTDLYLEFWADVP